MEAIEERLAKLEGIGGQMDARLVASWGPAQHGDHAEWGDPLQKVIRGDGELL